MSFESFIPSGTAAERRRAPDSPGVAVRIPVDAIRAHDIRGRVGRDIDRAGAYALGLSCATAAQREGVTRIGVARDGRLSSPTLEQSLVWGLMDGGLKVERLGVGPAPMLHFAVRTLGLGAAVMVTASQGSPADNGFKIMIGGARVQGDALRALVQGPADRARMCGSARRRSIVESYAAALAEAATGMAPLKVAWDCGHGACGPVVERLVKALPGEHLLLNAEVNGGFPAHPADPAVAANLSQLADTVLAKKCDLGVAFDADGDRLGVVDALGRIVRGDELLLLLARDLLERRPGAGLVADLACGKALFDGVAAAGGQAKLAPPGYAPLREAMLRQGALLGGQLSGRVVLDDGWGGVDDALYAAVRTLLAASRVPGGLAGFRESLPPSFATEELRITCPDGRKAAVVAEVAARLAGDGAHHDPRLGLRVERADGWWMLRAATSAPKLRARCEAIHPDGLDRLRGELERQLGLSGLNVDV